MRELLSCGSELYGAGDPVKSFRRIALLRRIVRYGFCAAIVLSTMGADDCFAGSPSFEYLDVTIENITYQGSSTYRIDIMVYNRSDKAIVLRERSETFQVQTEILGRWQELSASDASPVGSALLPTHKGLRVVYILKIPLTMRSLYKNGEGDINMMFKYLIRFVPDSETRLLSKSGESSYWITPNTNTWVLREGM